MPYVAKYVRATGRVFERGGMKAIAIDEIRIEPTTRREPPAVTSS
jgi:hypothetical protein